MTFVLIHLLSEANVHREPAVEQEEDIEKTYEEPQEAVQKDEVHIMVIETVKIPEITVRQETHSATEGGIASAEIVEEPAPKRKVEQAPLPEARIQSEDAASNHWEEAEEPQSPPAEQPVETIPDSQEEDSGNPVPTQMTNSPQRIDLSSEELKIFIQTQTVNNRVRAFPRIHITYEDVDMGTQLSFYRSKGYGFFAVEIKDGAITKIIGEIDVENRRLSAADTKDGLAWNYGSVITGSEYRKIAVEASANPHAYLAVVPTYHIVNLILGSIDKGINGVIDGDYRDYRSYKATFTTRGRDAILIILIPDRGTFTRREILLSRNTNA